MKFTTKEKCCVLILIIIVIGVAANYLNGQSWGVFLSAAGIMITAGMSAAAIISSFFNQNKNNKDE